MTNEELQEKYVEYKLLEEQNKQLQQQIHQVDSQIAELTSIMNSLAEFSMSKNGSEILVPLASGIFAYAELKDNAHVRVNVGSNVSVRKNIMETQELIQNQMKELGSYRMQLVEQVSRIAAKIQMREKELIAHMQLQQQ